MDTRSESDTKGAPAGESPKPATKSFNELKVAVCNDPNFISNSVLNAQVLLQVMGDDKVQGEIILEVVEDATGRVIKLVAADYPQLETVEGEPAVVLSPLLLIDREYQKQVLPDLKPKEQILLRLIERNYGHFWGSKRDRLERVRQGSSQTEHQQHQPRQQVQHPRSGARGR